MGEEAVRLFLSLATTNEPAALTVTGESWYAGAAYRIPVGSRTAKGTFGGAAAPIPRARSRSPPAGRQRLLKTTSAADAHQWCFIKRPPLAVRQHPAPHG